jgi:hypothetical protein
VKSPEMLAFLNTMYDSGDDKVRILYKYRSCEAHNIDCLRRQQVWFSVPSQLNDPFDCNIRLPEKIEVAQVREVGERLASASPYLLDISKGYEVAKYVGEASDLPPLVSLGLMAQQLGHKHLVAHIREIHPSNEAWLWRLIEMARDLAHHLLDEITVFCLSERNDHQLMWAHYAGAHTGFCTGYVCPVGILNPALIHKVQYVRVPPKVTPWQLVDDPGGVHRDLVLTKPEPWAYEQEWRITFGNLAGLLDNLLPYREVILGAKISRMDEESIRAAVDGKCQIFRAIADSSDETFALRVEPAA